MGIFCSCCKGSSEDSLIVTPNADLRRAQQAQAAERRQAESERRGIKDVDKVRRQQERANEQDRRELEASKMGNNPALKWQAD